MNKELLEAIKLYSTAEKHSELNSLLLEKSKDQLIALFNDLLTAYINDKNSSSIREIIVTSVAGYIHNNKKIGYNGFKQVTPIGGDPVQCEVKPKNVSAEENLARKKNGKGQYKLNGQGNFTDYTPERLEKDLNENLNMLVAGFIDGELLYILEFPFSCKTFSGKLKKQLDKAFENGRKKGQFLRSASFNFKDYKDCKDLKLVYLKKKNLNLEQTKNNLTKDFYEFLKSF